MGHFIAATIFLSTLPYHTVSINKQPHKIYITIDDHPNKTTPKFLALLKKCKLKATFFIIGYPEHALQKYPTYPNRKLRLLHTYLLQIHRCGHQIGNHGITHRELCNLPLREIRWELGKNQRMLFKALGGKIVQYWRPPNTTECRKSFSVAKRLHLKIVRVDVSDYRSNAKYMWKKLLRRHRKHGKRESIVLFHNNLKKFKNFLKISHLCSF